MLDVDEARRRSITAEDDAVAREYADLTADHYHRVGMDDLVAEALVGIGIRLVIAQRRLERIKDALRRDGRIA